MVNILIADANVHIRNSIREITSCQPNMRIVGEAADNHECFRHVRRNKPDLILLDLHLPETGGLDVLRRIKRDLEDIAVIVLSPFDFNEYYETIAAYESDQCISKENLLRDLLPAIKATLNLDSST